MLEFALRQERFVMMICFSMTLLSALILFIWEPQAHLFIGSVLALLFILARFIPMPCHCIGEYCQSMTRYPDLYLTCLSGVTLMDCDHTSSSTWNFITRLIGAVSQLCMAKLQLSSTRGTSSNLW